MNILNNNDEKEYRRRGNPDIGMQIDKAKNKGASSLQITAEQIIRASQAHATDEVQISDVTFDTKEELEDYKSQKRKKFETQTQRQRFNVRSWFKYADWEENLGEYERARNLYKRAIEIEYKNVSIWLKYAEMEIRGKFINHARNVFEQAIKLLPKIDQLWFKYAYMEEMLGNYIGCREIFRNWMTWNPSENAWMAYAKYEERMGEINNARKVLFEFISRNKNLNSYLKVAKYEEKSGNYKSAREIYEAALVDLKDKVNEDFFIQFIKFEIKMKEINRSRVLFKFGLDNIIDNNEKLKLFYTKFEKMYGFTEEIDELVIDKRRKIYEEHIRNNPSDYDYWFEYIKMEEDCLANVYYINEIITAKKKIILEDNSSLNFSNYNRTNGNTHSNDYFLNVINNQIKIIRELYERAIVNIPIIEEKKYWKRYIYFFINYALFEELETNDIKRIKSIYKKILDLIPHKKFTFSKLWILYSQFLIRQKDLKQARLNYGQNIGLNPCEKVFQSYIELELQLNNLDRCRKLYEKQIECFPNSSKAWINYAEFEESLEEHERAKGILECAINQVVDMPETVWKIYINLEIKDGNYNKVRKLYERLLERSKHVKVFCSFSRFEEDIKEYEKSRSIFNKAYEYYKLEGNNNDRAEIVFKWLDFERRLNNNFDNSEGVTKIEKLIPIKVKKRRVVENNVGFVDGVNKTLDLNETNDTINSKNWEEYYDYNFNDDEEKKVLPKSLKLLQNAKAWREKREKELQNKAKNIAENKNGIISNKNTYDKENNDNKYDDALKNNSKDNKEEIELD